MADRTTEGPVYWAITSFRILSTLTRLIGRLIRG